MYTGIIRFLQHWKASCEVICLVFFLDGNILLGTATCNLATKFYRRNKNLKFWWLMRFVGSLKQPNLLGLSGVKGQYSVVGGTNLLWIALLGHACLIATPGLGWNNCTPKWRVVMQLGSFHCLEMGSFGKQHANSFSGSILFDLRKKHAKIPKHSDDGNPK